MQGCAEPRRGRCNSQAVSETQYFFFFLEGSFTFAIYKAIFYGHGDGSELLLVHTTK